MVTTAHDVHYSGGLQVLHERGNHTIGGNALHLITSAKLTIATTTKLVHKFNEWIEGEWKQINVT